MGEARQKKQRLGVWYGRKVAPGHPDWREPTKPAVRPVRDRDRLRGESMARLVTDDAEPTKEPETRTALVGAPGAENGPTAPEEPRRPEPPGRVAVVGGPGMRRPVRALGMLGVVALVSTALAGADIGPPPEPKRRA